MRRSHDSDVDLDGTAAPQPLEPTLLQDPQELHLGIRSQLADFVQEQGAAVSALEPAALAFRRLR